MFLFVRPDGSTVLHTGKLRDLMEIKNRKLSY